MARQTSYVTKAKDTVNKLQPKKDTDSLVLKLRDLVVLRKSWVWNNAFNRVTLLTALFPGDSDGNFAARARDEKAKRDKLAEAKPTSKDFYKTKCDITDLEKEIKAMADRAAVAVSRFKQLLYDHGIYFLAQKTQRSHVSSHLYCVALDKLSLDIAVAKHSKGERGQAKYRKLAQKVLQQI